MKITAHSIPVELLLIAATAALLFSGCGKSESPKASADSPSGQAEVSAQHRASRASRRPGSSAPVRQEQASDSPQQSPDSAQMTTDTTPVTAPATSGTAEEEKAAASQPDKEYTETSRGYALVPPPAGSTIRSEWGTPFDITYKDEVAVAGAVALATQEEVRIFLRGAGSDNFARNAKRVQIKLPGMDKAVNAVLSENGEYLKAKVPPAMPPAQATIYIDMGSQSAYGSVTLTGLVKQDKLWGEENK